MFDLLVALGIVGSLLFYIPTRIDGDELFAFYFCVIVSIYSFFITPKRNVKMALPGLMALMAIFTTFNHFFQPEREVTINLVFGFLAIKAIAENTDLTVKKVGIALIFFFLICSAIIVMQILGIEKFYYSGEVSGPFLKPWVLGCVAVISIPFIFSVSPAWCAVLLPSILVPLKLGSAGWSVTILSSVIFSFMFYKKNKRLFNRALLISLPSALISLLMFGHDLDKARIKMILGTFKYIEDHLFGNGIGRFAHSAFTMMNGKDDYYWRWAHNEFYQHYYEQGAIGLLLAMAFLITLLKVKDHCLRMALVSISILSIFHSILHFGSILVLIIVTVALTVKSIQGEKHG